MAFFRANVEKSVDGNNVSSISKMIYFIDNDLAIKRIEREYIYWVGAAASSLTSGTAALNVHIHLVDAVSCGAELFSGALIN